MADYTATIPPITTGTTGLGLRWARSGDWRILAYAEGGWSLHRLLSPVGQPMWCIADHDTDAPEDVIQALCLALNVPYVSAD